MAQFTTVPSVLFTSTCSQVWGLTHSIFVIVPLKFTGLFASNSAANAWWADAEEAHPDTARPMTPIAMASFVPIVCLLQFLQITGRTIDRMHRRAVPSE